MTPDLERLAQLREAVCGEYTAYLDPWERPTDEEVAFFEAAHAALSPDGCVTKELERLRRRVAELEAQQTKQYGSYLRCRGYADCSAEQRATGCAECERVK